MITTPNTSTAQVITKKVTRTTKSYTEDGKLYEEVTEEEITYESAPARSPWYGQPVVTNTTGINTHRNHTYIDRPLLDSDAGQVE